MNPTETNPDFSISRTFDAPRDLVFKVWTEPEHLVNWWGPKGSAVDVARLDLRAGGSFHYSLSSPHGDMCGIWKFREVAAPERLVFVSSFSDVDGNVTRAPFPGDFPLEVLSTVVFTEADGKTTLSMTGHPLNASEAEQKFFADMHAGMEQGWGGTFESLEAYLESVR